MKKAALEEPGEGVQWSLAPFPHALKHNCANDLLSTIAKVLHISDISDKMLKLGLVEGPEGKGACLVSLASWV